MLPVSDDFKKAINMPGRTIKAKLVFSDSVIEGDIIKDITIEDSILTGDEFEVGTFISTKATVTLINGSLNAGFEGKECEIHLGVLIDTKVIEFINIGIFTIRTQNVKEQLITLTLDDRTIKFDELYKSNLAYPTSLLSIVHDVCNKLGFILKTTNFVNCNYIVGIAPTFDSDLTFRKVIAQIAELAGGYARVNPQGELEIFNLYNSGLSSTVSTGVSNYAQDNQSRLFENSVGLINLDRTSYIDLYKGKNGSESITKVVVKVGDITAELGVDTESSYYIQNNIFCQNPNDVIEGLYYTLAGLSYKNIKTKWVGNPSFQTGDLVTIHDGYVLHNTYIMRRKLSFSGGLTEELEAIGKTKEENKNPVKGNVTAQIGKTIVQIKIMADKIEQKVDNDEFQSYIIQTAEEIATKVTAEEACSAVVQNADKLKISIDGKLKGRTYTFDGDGFTIGGTEGDVAKHTPSGSEYKFADGSKVLINKDGFYNMIGSTKREYHHLSYVFAGQKTIAGNFGDGKFTHTITLPSEFKGKNFTVTPYITDSYLSNGQFSLKVENGIWVKSIDKEAGTVLLEGAVVLLHYFIDGSGDEYTVKGNYSKNSSAIVKFGAEITA